MSQQGFQFFPDKKTAGIEVYRVLKPGGKVILSAWSSMEDCNVFKIIGESLQKMGEQETAQTNRRSFVVLPQKDLTAFFEQAGFSNITTHKKSLPLEIVEGENLAYDIAFATPTDPMPEDLSPVGKSLFKDPQAKKIMQMGNRLHLGQMTSNILVAVK